MHGDGEYAWEGKACGDRFAGFSRRGADITEGAALDLLFDSDGAL